MCFSRFYFIDIMYENDDACSTSCALFIHVHNARRNGQLIWYDEFFLVIYIPISM